MVRLIRGARGFTSADGTYRRLWQVQVFCKSRGVMFALTGSKRMTTPRVYPIASLYVHGEDWRWSQIDHKTFIKKLKNKTRSSMKNEKKLKKIPGFELDFLRTCLINSQKCTCEVWKKSALRKQSANLNKLRNNIYSGCTCYTICFFVVIIS